MTFILNSEMSWIVHTHEGCAYVHDWLTPGELGAAWNATMCIPEYADLDMRLGKRSIFKFKGETFMFSSMQVRNVEYEM